MRTWLGAGFGAVIALQLAAFGLLAQDTVRIGDTPSCARCELSLRMIVTLRMPSDSVAYPGMMASVVRDSRGRFLLLPLDNLGTMAQFDSSGRFVRTLGRVGQGPGEFRMATIARVGSADSLWVLDAPSHRISLFAPDGRFVRSVAVDAYAYDFLVPRDGQFVFNGTAGRRDGNGQPLHLQDSSGKVIASFGNGGVPARPGNPTDHRRRIEIGQSGFWSMRVNRYEIEEMSFSGSVRRLLMRDAKWFPAWTDSPPGRVDDRPDIPWVRGIQVDERRWIHVVVQVAEEKWKPAPPLKRAAPAGSPGDSSLRGVQSTSRPTLNVVESEKFLDTFVEVIDPVAGRVVTSKRFPQTLIPSQTPGIFYRYRDDRAVLELEVYQLTLVVPPRQ